MSENVYKGKSRGSECDDLIQLMHTSSFLCNGKLPFGAKDFEKTRKEQISEMFKNMPP